MKKPKLRVALLGAANSVHIMRWANGLAVGGLDVHLMSIHPPDRPFDPRVNIHVLPGRARPGYFTAAPALRKTLKSLAPDILNAHYASGYGLLARLCGFKPLLLSVWGDDIFEFPKKTALHRLVLKSNLGSATALAATSKCLAEGLAGLGLAEKPVFITPFGVDTDMFRPEPGGKPGQFVIGTVKALAPKYGVDVLIRAFALAWARLGRPDDFGLEITGGGPDRPALEALAGRLEIGGRVSFRGAVPHDQVPAALRRLDIYLALSRGDGETFGVAVLEAAACEKPIIVSDAPGLAETTIDGETGLVVPREQPEAAAEAIIRLVRDPALAARLGKAAREHVLKNYSWPKSLKIMVETYVKVMAGGSAEFGLEAAAGVRS